MYIDGKPEMFVYHYEFDGKIVGEMESTTHLIPCKSIAVRELDIEGLIICFCGKHSKEVAKRMRIGGYEIIEKVI